MGFFDRYPYTNWHNVNLDWVLERVKEWGQMVEANNQAFKDLEEANENFKNYVKDNFDNEINDTINALLDSGELAEYFTPYIDDAVTGWLDDNITQPTNPVIDKSLTVEGAGADSKIVGDNFKNIESNIAQIVNNGASLSNSIKYALLQYLKNMAFVDCVTGRDLYYILKSALNLSPISKISAMYYNPDNDIIYNYISYEDLKKYIKVFAHYMNGEVAEITSYNISGDINVGNSTLIINYDNYYTNVTIYFNDWNNIPNWSTDNRVITIQRIPGQYVNRDNILTFGVSDFNINRYAFFTKNGFVPTIDSQTLDFTNYYPIPICKDKNYVSVTFTNTEDLVFAVTQWSFNSETKLYTRLSDSGFKENGSTIELNPNASFIGVNSKKLDGSAITIQPQVNIIFTV